MTYEPGTEEAITRALHLALIAQVQAWEAINNLESLLTCEYPGGSPEIRAAHLYVTDAIQEMASDPVKNIGEMLRAENAETLRLQLLAHLEAHS